MKRVDVNKSDSLHKSVCFGHGLKASLKSDGQLPPQLSLGDTTRLECRSVGSETAAARESFVVVFCWESMSVQGRE